MGDVLATLEGWDRMIDLAYSLHECLGDFVDDAQRIAYVDDDERMAIVHRLHISAMNCLADMALLEPGFKELSCMRNP